MGVPLAAILACLVAAASSSAAQHSARLIPALDGVRKLQELGVPANAHVIFGMWFCDVGYQRVDGACEKKEIPANAHETSYGWSCDDGYRWSPQECIPIDIPDNAFAIGSGWECSLGFRRQGDQCSPMSEEETLAVLERTRARLAADLGLTPEELWKLWVIQGSPLGSESLDLSSGAYGFSAWTLENSCRVHQPTVGSARLECVGAEAWAIREQCVVIMRGTRSWLQCRGPDGGPYRVLMNCLVTMENNAYGRITCS